MMQKNTSIIQIFTVLGTILLLLSFFSACVQNSTPPNSAIPDNSPITVTLNSAYKTAEINGITPKPGTVFVVVDLTIENRGDKDYTFNENAVSISKGTTVDENLYTKITGHKYWGAIPSHEKRTGEVIFGTGNSTQDYTLTFFYHNHRDSFTQELGTIPMRDSSSSADTSKDGTIIIQASDKGSITKIQDQPQKGSVELTINSAKKMMSLGEAHPINGHIFLVLDITVTNLNVDQGYNLGNKSINLKDSEGKIFNLEFNSRPVIQKELQNPITPQTKLGLNDTITGQVIFGVPDSSNYNLNMMGKGGTEVLTSQPVNFDNLLTTEKPVSLTIHSVNKLTSVNKSGVLQYPMPGHIFLILDVTIKNNDIPEGFIFTEGSTNLLDLKGGEFVEASLNSGLNLREKLENPLIPLTNIEQNHILNGQLVFGIADSTDYRLNLLDNTSTIILSKNIHAE